MSRWLYRILNPVVVWLLTSPLHPLLSGNTLLLHYRGRRSGRSYRTPVSYHEQDGLIHCFAGLGHHWWRNLEDGATVSVTLRGRRIDGEPAVDRGDHPAIARQLGAFLAAVPRDAPHAGVRLDANGNPIPADLTAAAPRHVHVTIRPLG